MRHKKNKVRVSRPWHREQSPGGLGGQPELKKNVLRVQGDKGGKVHAPV